MQEVKSANRRGKKKELSRLLDLMNTKVQLLDGNYLKILVALFNQLYQTEKYTMNDWYQNS